MVFQEDKFPKKLGIFIELDPQKGLFQGVGDLVLVLSECKPVLGDAWVSGGSIVHAYRPWYLQSCGRKCDAVREKRQNGQTARELLCSGAI